MDEQTMAAWDAEHNEAADGDHLPAPVPLVPRRSAPGKLPKKPQAARNGESARARPPKVEVAKPVPMAEMSNREFAAVPENADDPAPAELIVIRRDEGGMVSYRTFGMETGAAAKVALTATAHLCGAVAEERDQLVSRMNAAIGAIVGQPPGQ